ncbi:MAG: hypothetical protein OQK82_04930, partial [Candidatus Pacearchaeota archaeon]|nr:hypothetical protein [Candidatus Pacearchaeota archaeon]
MKLKYLFFLRELRLLMTILTILFFIAALPLYAETFPEGDVEAYIDAVDAVFLPLNCKARMIINDSYSTGSDRNSEG